jgi:membrane-associated protease RseP (regulator of RpoE activity)
VTDILSDPTETSPPDDGAPVEQPVSRANSWARLAALGLGIVALGLIGGISVLAIVFAIVVSIFLHELGHFIVAKRAGMKVTEFFIGFGPRIWSFQRGETEYGIKVLPAGAYVRIIGMNNLEQVDPADEARTYRAQPYRRRLPVVLAGPFANFAIAFVLLFAIFVGWGQANEQRWTVDRVVTGSAADQAGLQPGDRIVSFNGESVTDFTSLSDLIASSPGGTVTIDYEREGEQLSTTAPLGWRLDSEAASALPPLRSGDQLLSVNGQDVSTYDVLAAQLASADTGTATVVFDRQGFRYETEVTTPVQLPSDGYAGFLGVGPEVPRDRLDPAAAVGEATTSFGSVVKESVLGIGKMFSPSGISDYFDNVKSASTNDETRTDTAAIRPLESTSPTVSSGEPQNQNRPISILGIGRLGAQAFDSGPTAFLWLLVIVNIFLGLFNLVPLPPLDGGHAAIATYEAIREKISGRRYRVDIAKLMPVTYAVVLLFLVIGVSSIYLDIVDPVQNPFGP